MYASTIFALSAGILPVALGSDGHGHRHLNVRNAHSALHSRGIHSRSHLPQFHGHHPKPPAASGKLAERATVVNTNIDGQCGVGFGSCADGICCSPAGWCGTTEAYCAAPDCQINYGPGCDANQSPPGSSTSGVTRTQSKSPSIAYGGAGIYSCTKPGTVAITYDDGPYIYTKNVLDLYDKYNGKATFFITGNNLGKGKIDDTSTDWPAIIKRMYSTGHQIASHTWGHQDLSTLTTTQLQNQIYYNEMAFRNLLGFFPTYMRPPYSSCGSACQSFLGTAGYHIIYFDTDTSDYLFDTPDQIQISKDYITTNLTLRGDPTTNSFLVVGHDIDQQESYNLTEFMLQSFTDKGFKLVTVGECLSDATTNWYRTASGAGVYSSTTSMSSSSTPLPSPTGVSTDGSCGSANMRTCLNSQFGNCCSYAGWCGTTSDFCGTGCQVGYGTCGSNSVAVSSLGSVAVSSGLASVLPSVVASSVASAATGTSTDGTCGPANNMGCLNSGYGNCCSFAGWCGSTTNHCGTGCQAGYGTCGSSSVAASGASSAKAVSAANSAAAKSSVAASVASSAAGSLATATTTDGTCGPLNKMGCLNSGYGNCCSPEGWCGSTTNHCGTGCQAGYGTCGSNSVAASAGKSSTSSKARSQAASSAKAASSSVKASSPAKAASSSVKASSASGKSSASRASGTASVAAPLATVVSTDGQCGPSVKTTCLKSDFGDCCSVAGWCGSTDPYCGSGCQAGYGSCT